MDKLRIALVSSPFFTCPPRGYGGLEQVVFDLFSGLTELGHKVVLFAPKGSQVPPGGFVYETGEPLTTTNVDWFKAEENMWSVYKDKLADFDVINSHNWFGLPYASKIEKPQLKICQTMHGHLNPEYWLKSKPPFKLNFIGISKHMQAEYRQQGMESQYVYNGIDLHKYQFKKEKGDRLLFVGRLSPIKQPHVAIEIAKQLGLGIDIVGGTFVAPQEVAYMEQIIGKCDIVHKPVLQSLTQVSPPALSEYSLTGNNKIVVYPDAPHETKVQLMQNAKCLIFPSNMGEPFGLVAAEAGATGTGVVSTADGAIGEVVENGVTGFVCRSVPEMIEAVKKIDTISPEACRKRVEEKFSRQVMSRGYERLYREILEGREW